MYSSYKALYSENERSIRSCLCLVLKCLRCLKEMNADWIWAILEMREEKEGRYEDEGRTVVEEGFLIKCGEVRGEFGMFRESMSWMK